MEFRNRRRALVALVALFALLLSACNGNGGDTGEGDGDGEAANGTDQAAEEAFTIGVSNGFVGSEWRTQMIDDIQQVFAEYEEQGLVDELIIESADVDVDGQIQQIRTLVNAGADAIIVNPNSPDALNAAFEEAEEAGVRIYAVDQAVTSPAVTNVVIDQYEWAQISAEWLVDQLEEGDPVVGVNGIAGHPANEARWNGATEVLEGGGLEILTQANANWSQSEGATVTADLLSQHGDVLEGIWAQDGVAEGVLRALIDADRLDIVATGEARAGYMRLWAEHDYETIGVVNPPGVGATALRIALRELQGEQLDEAQLEDGNTLYLPMPGTVTNENLEEMLAEVEDQPDSYSLDVILSEDEIDQYFQ